MINNAQSVNPYCSQSSQVTGTTYDTVPAALSRSPELELQRLLRTAHQNAAEGTSDAHEAASSNTSLVAWHERYFGGVSTDDVSQAQERAKSAAHQYRKIVMLDAHILDKLVKIRKGTTAALDLTEEEVTHLAKVLRSLGMTYPMTIKAIIKLLQQRQSVFKPITMGSYEGTTITALNSPLSKAATGQILKEMDYLELALKKRVFTDTEKSCLLDAKNAFNSIEVLQSERTEKVEIIRQYCKPVRTRCDIRQQVEEYRKQHKSYEIQGNEDHESSWVAYDTELLNPLQPRASFSDRSLYATTIILQKKNGKGESLLQQHYQRFLSALKSGCNQFLSTK